MSKNHIDVSKAIGYNYPIEKVSYNKRDLVLYALGIGVNSEDLKYIYELDKDFTPLPTYPLVLQLKGDSNDVNSFLERSIGMGMPPELPRLDPNRIVHGEQKIDILRTIPTNGDFELRTKINAIYDKGSGMVIEQASTLIDPKTNIEYAIMTGQTFNIGYGGFGGPKGPKGPVNSPPKDKKPDAVDIFKTDINQATLYRLSGDYNPLHIDPTIASKLGFERPILHGLCSYGHAAYAITKHFGNNDPKVFKSMYARFTSPVYPGDTLETYMWKANELNGKTNIIFVVKAKERNKIVLGNGLAILTNNNIKGKL